MTPPIAGVTRRAAGTPAEDTAAAAATSTMTAAGKVAAAAVNTRTAKIRRLRLLRTTWEVKRPRKGGFLPMMIPREVVQMCRPVEVRHHTLCTMYYW